MSGELSTYRQQQPCCYHYRLILHMKTKVWGDKFTFPCVVGKGGRIKTQECLAQTPHTCHTSTYSSFLNVFQTCQNFLIDVLFSFWSKKLQVRACQHCFSCLIPPFYGQCSKSSSIIIEYINFLSIKHQWHLARLYASVYQRSSLFMSAVYQDCF